MIREKHELKVEGDLKLVVLVRGTKSSRLPRERRAVVPKLGSADAWGSVRL